MNVILCKQAKKALQQINEGHGTHLKGKWLWSAGRVRDNGHGGVTATQDIVMKTAGEGMIAHYGQILSPDH